MVFQCVGSMLYTYSIVKQCHNIAQYIKYNIHVHVLQAQKPVQVTCPYGTLDPLMDRAHLSAFPVPSSLLHTTPELHTDAQRNGLDETQYGQSFCSNAFKGDAAAMLAAALRQVHLLHIALDCKAVNISNSNTQMSCLANIVLCHQCPLPYSAVSWSMHCRACS